LPARPGPAPAVEPEARSGRRRPSILISDCSTSASRTPRRSPTAHSAAG
jgi:hypothetical protein